MKKAFREYHQFTEQEYISLWEKCLFVFDTNTLLNMYRYSRTTVETYFNVLNELKGKKQLWIPHQVGLEFYENRIDVIAEYESSYDSILNILDKAKKDIETKYKDHPFLDLVEIKKQIESGLSTAEKQIKKAKEEHPKWMSSDDVLNKINDVFDDNIANCYDPKKLSDIIKEGEDRYEKKIPPGFKDIKKSDDRKFGDLILWYQIIDKANETKKPIILISGDVKEDWWLEKNGERLMPLPQLKKEMLDKANVDFHIYTADRFLEYYLKDRAKDKTVVSEVRKIRELEEQRMMRKRLEFIEQDSVPKMFEHHLIKCVHEFDIVDELLASNGEFKSGERFKLMHVSQRIREYRNRIFHGNISRITVLRLHRYIQDYLTIIDDLIQSGELNLEVATKLRPHIDRLDHINRQINLS